MGNPEENSPADAGMEGGDGQKNWARGLSFFVSVGATCSTSINFRKGFL
jgi:hypothetical protein